MQQEQPATPVFELRLRARRIITPAGERSGVVVARGGVITEVTDAGPATAGEVVVPDNCVLLPGLVDSHVHVNEPGRTQWEGFATATAAAAAGGITTITDMPLNSIPPTVDVASLTVKQAAARGQLSADVAFWGGAVPGNAGDLRALHEAGVAGFKCFLLPSGVPEFPPLDAAGLLAAMTEIAAFGGLLIAHAEDPGVIDAAPAAHGPGYQGFLASRPPAAEVAAVRGLLAATRRTGCRTHIVHLSAAAALPDITRARGDGLPVTVETCPHYLALAAEQVPDGATQFKCCPPVRGAANREQLWQALETGLIDCVVSDHSPCPVADKRLDTGDFGAAWGGIASLELSLPVTWTAAAARGRSLAEVARWMAAAPARVAGLRDRGEVRPGAQADFCVLAPDEEFTVDPARLRQRHPLTPYAGLTLRGVVRQTWLRGEPARQGAGRLVTLAGEERHG
ncbi:MAG TPA: allantoinase AllB [Streptosporangiaceae bacterium]|nr:allantoinase AllB [Streptosporangiaceae bacterium]